MSRTLSIWALSIGIILSALAIPAEAARSRSRTRSINGTFSGVITRLNRSQMSIETGDGDARGKLYTFNYDQGTSVTGGSKKGTIDDLVIGQNVKVVVKNNRADKIEVSVK